MYNSFSLLKKKTGKRLREDVPNIQNKMNRLG
jgi:hypothetical protein